MARSGSVTEHPAVWFQASACSGCVVSALNGVAPNVMDLIVDQIAPGHHVSLRFVPTIMAGSGQVALEILAATEESKEGYLLVIDGALPTAAGGLFGRAAGKGGGESTMVARARRGRPGWGGGRGPPRGGAPPPGPPRPDVWAFPRRWPMRG